VTVPLAGGGAALHAADQEMHAMLASFDAARDQARALEDRQVFGNLRRGFAQRFRERRHGLIAKLAQSLQQPPPRRVTQRKNTPSSCACLGPDAPKDARARGRLPVLSETPEM
jgi:hypothetical protein